MEIDNFIEKLQLQIEKKMISCVNGESIVKPFNNIYEEVRKNVLKKEEDLNAKYKNVFYSDGEASIYTEVVEMFLKEHPELMEKKNTNKDTD